MYQNQGSFKREGTLTNDLFVPAKSAPCQLIPSKSVGKYRDEIYSLQILISRTQAGPCRTVKQEQEQISPNHVHRINLISVHHVQRLAKRLVRGCEKFVPALVFLFCLTLPGSCLARFPYLIADILSVTSVSPKG